MTQQEAGPLVVEQCDREAAARLIRRGRLSLKELVAADMEQGRADDSDVVQAFAAHRHRSVAPMQEVAVASVEEGRLRASAIDANDVLQRQRRHKGAFHRDDVITAMQEYAEQFARATLTGSAAE